MKKIVIIGNGPGAISLASRNLFLESKDYEVSLFYTKNDFFPSECKVCWQEKTISLDSKNVTSDPSKVIPEAEIIILCNPYNTHERIVDLISPFITNKLKLLCAIPGAIGFDWLVNNKFKGKNLKFNIVATETLPYIAKVEETHKIMLKAIKSNMYFSQKIYCNDFMHTEFLENFLGLQLTPLSNFLQLAFLNPGAKVNPILFLEALKHQENSIERNNYEISLDNEFLLKDIEEEINFLSEKFSKDMGINVTPPVSLKEWFIKCYPTLIKDKSTTKSCMSTHEVYSKMSQDFLAGINKDSKRKSRYLTEQIPYGLIPLKGLAELIKIDTPAIDSIILKCEKYLGKKYLNKDHSINQRALDETSSPQKFGTDVLSKLNRLYQPHSKSFEIEKEEFKRNGVTFMGKILKEEGLYKKINDEVTKKLKTVPKDDNNQSLLNLHWKDETFAKFCSLPEFVSIASKLLGSEEVRVFSSIIVIKHPNSNMVVPWHQDAAYEWPIDPIDCACLWLALDDTTIENGAMVFAAGGHQKKFQMHPTKKSSEEEYYFSPQLKKSINTSTLNNYKKIECEMNQYECSFHHSLIPHSSPVNKTETRRCAFIVRYCKGNTKVKTWPGMPREEFFKDYKLFNPHTYI